MDCTKVENFFHTTIISSAFFLLKNKNFCYKNKTGQHL